MPLFFKGPSVAPDPRPKATSRIWVFSLLMMAVAIPMVETTQSAVIPLFILAAAALSTAAVWLFGESSQKREARDAQALRQSREEIAALQSTVAEMRDRLECLETISRYERLRDQSALEADAAAFGMADDSMGASAPSPSASRRPARRDERGKISL